MNAHEPRLGAHFTSRRERGSEGLPTLSVTLDRGLVPRDTLERRTETNLLPEEHLRVREGDIAYNMMRMWQGASGLAEMDALVSPAYVVLAPKKSVDPLFAAYLFKLPEMIHRFWAYSYGLTDDRLRLYFNDFKRIPWDLPPLPEQKKIAEILSTWDKAIETTEKLLANAEAQKRALMQQLLTGKRRLKGFEGGLRPQVRFGDVVRLSKDRLDPGSKHSAMTCVELEHLESGTGRLVSSTSSDQQASIKTVFRPGDVLFGKLRPYLQKFLMPDFEGACSTEIWALRPDPSRLTTAYLLALVQTPEFLAEANRSSGSKMPRADWSVVSRFQFSLPPVDEQNAIGEIATDCDREVANLLASKAALELEKRALMQQLLTGKRRVAI